MQHYANFCSKSLSYFNPFGVSNYNILNIVRRAHQKKTFVLRKYQETDFRTYQNECCLPIHTYVIRYLPTLKIR